MGLLDVAAQNASLDNDYGATKGPNSPASLELALFNGDPTLGGVEMDAVGGYAAVSMTNDGTNFPAAADGQKVCAEQTFATPTGEWTAAGVADTATHWCLRDSSTGTVWDYDVLTEEVNVEIDDDTGAIVGGPVKVQPIIYYGDQSVESLA